MGYDRDDYRGRQAYGRGGYGNEYGRREERYDDSGYAYGGQRDFRRQGGDDDRGGHGNDRGFIERAGDEVRSWFGDDEAERRRERDTRYSNGAYGGANRQDYSQGYARDVDRSSGQHNDGFFDRVGRWFDGDAPRSGTAARGADHDDYRGWRTRQMEALDRDYHEYREENRSRFENEFGEFRNRRQTQRASLSQVKEHFEVLGSDGEHVGKVDKVRGDRIILAKNDPAAGGHHHSIPSRWLQSVEGERVTITKTAAEAKQAWTDLDNNSAMFGDSSGASQGDGPHVLNRSFPGTY